MAAKLKFYPLGVRFVKKQNGYALISGKLESGERILVIDRSFKPYFYLDTEQKDKYELTEKIVHNKKTKLSKVFEDSSSVAGQPFKSDAKAYEHDIGAERQYLLTKGIQMCSSTEFEYREAQMRARVPVFEALSIRNTGEDSITEFKTVAIDIETYVPRQNKRIDAERNPILMAALYTEGERYLITTKHYNSKHDYVLFVKSEEELLRKTLEILIRVKPDIITGYNSDRFDLAYIKKRCEKYGIDVDIAADYSGIETDSKTGEISVLGMMHIDSYHFTKSVLAASYDLDEMSLAIVAKRVLGMDKIEVNIEELSRLWDDNDLARLDIFSEYCMKDADIAYNLLRKIMPQLTELIKIIEMPLSSVSRMSMSRLVEALLIRVAYSENIAIPNKPEYVSVKKRHSHTFKGAYVKTPHAGLYKDIAVFDFRSLYPSIIASYNISPETIECSCCKAEYSFDKLDAEFVDDEMLSMRTWFCKNKIGLFPKLIRDILARRARISAMHNNEDIEHLEVRSNTLKLIANSFYGYLAYPSARWYNAKCAEVTTAYGRYFLKKLIAEAENTGIEIIYADTDSIFVNLTKDNTLSKINSFVNGINQTLPEFMELELEDVYKSAIFVEAKQHEEGAKKKYALIGSNNMLKIRGFEAVKSNYSNIARRTQKEVLRLILSQDGDPLLYVNAIIAKIRTMNADMKDVELKVRISKHLDKYSASLPHIEAAKKMKALGYDVKPGTIVRYIIVKGEGALSSRAVPVEAIKDEEYDAEYYAEHQIMASVEKIFEAAGIKSGSDGLSRFI